MLNLLKSFFVMLNAHRGQKDKAGKPYFLHPLRVSKNVQGKQVKMVALLHDVLEDSDKYTMDDLYFLNDEQKAALNLLTIPKGMEYFDYVHRLSESDIAVKVKLSDLNDNSNLKRLDQITKKDLARKQKYSKAITILTV